MNAASTLTRLAHASLIGIGEEAVHVGQVASIFLFCFPPPDLDAIDCVLHPASLLISLESASLKGGQGDACKGCCTPIQSFGASFVEEEFEPSDRDAGYNSVKQGRACTGYLCDVG